MTDRSGAGPEAEGDMACGPKADLDLFGDDRAGIELDHFLDHLDDIDRDQRHFERYGSDGDDPDPMEQGGLDAPLVFELGNIRSLLANWAFVQSAMSLDDPDRLMLDYTRQMMGFLLFNPSPEAIEIIGLGGGSLAKYCYRHLPETAITAVEIDPEIIAVGEQFFMPPEDDRFEIICDDGAEFVRRDTGNCDVLLVDGFDKDGQPAQLCSLEFYRDCRSRLNPGGVLVVNLCDHLWKQAAILSRIRACFGTVIDLSAKIGMNRVLFAFKDERPGLDHRELQKLVRDLDHVHPISFSSLANEILNRIKSLDPSPVTAAGHDFDASHSLSMAQLWSVD
ncbi:fused MFS/spermidine synthase [Sphingopyxis fribergensis]